MFGSIDEVVAALDQEQYIADRPLATALFLSARLGKPLLLEGEAGVGKTEVAKVVAKSVGARLIRLQGYEGIDVNAAVYEWNYARQIMAIRQAELLKTDNSPDLFSREFLIPRPILDAVESSGTERVVLLIDELDRADDEFEAFLLEVLSDFQVSIPELGTIRAESPPVVFITSNRTRELHEALKRRCLYHWIGYPDFEREARILERKAPEAGEQIRRQVVRFIQAVRALDLYKAPGVSESIDWTSGLTLLGVSDLDLDTVRETIGLVLKNEEDIAQVRDQYLPQLVNLAKA